MLDRDVFSVIQLGFGFLVLLSAFNGQGFIEVAVLRSLSEDGTSGISANSGYYSMAIIYLFMTVSNFAVPTVISRIGAKWSMTLGAGCYVFFLLGFLNLSVFLLYAFSALLGVGAAMLWTASGVFLVEFSGEGKLTRNSGILWFMIQGSLIPGAIFLTFVLQKGNLEDSYRLLYTVFSGFGVLAVFSFFFLPKKPHQRKNEKSPISFEKKTFWDFLKCRSKTIDEKKLQKKTVLEDLKDIWTLGRSRKMATLLVMFFYLGIEASFANGVFTGCLSATQLLSDKTEAIIAYAIFALAGGHLLGASLFGMFARVKAKFGVRWVVGLGLTCHLCAYTLCFISLPFYSPLGKTNSPGIINPTLSLVLIIAFLLGFAGSCWHTQSMVLIGDLFKGPNLGTAFAIYKLCQSLAACAVFVYSAHLELHWQLAIASIFGILGFAAYIIVHIAATYEEAINADDSSIVKRSSFYLENA